MAIIGHGDLASAITDREDVTWFASGVSNSGCVDAKEYEREIKLLCDQDVSRHIVYFSSLSIYYGDSMYVKHKKRVERFLPDTFRSVTIVRIGNIMWGKNPNTLVNYLLTHPEAELQNVYRHLITLEDFKYWMDLIPVGVNNQMNLTGDRWFVPDLFKRLHGKG